MAGKRNNFQPRGRRIRINEPLINDEIRNYPQVRVIYKERSNEKSPNDFTRVMTMTEARKLSQEMVLDLIEVKTDADIPILRLMAYDKYLWELKNALKQKSKTSTPPMKEVQLSATISEHDLEVKANKSREFFADGSKVKVVLRMRGRELARRYQSKESLRNFISMVSDVAVPEGPIRDDGNRAIVIMKKK